MNKNDEKQRVQEYKLNKKCQRRKSKQNEDKERNK